MYFTQISYTTLTYKPNNQITKHANGNFFLYTFKSYLFNKKQRDKRTKTNSQNSQKKQIHQNKAPRTRKKAKNTKKKQQINQILIMMYVNQNMQIPTSTIKI